ncbi:DUF1351 domain-containing protein [uncultured Desulfovibrio sp.]|uniref:DUF1351 domain-containing protein n=1 Tax=uncultured Desulfovibrio sp. TaxID=167968 RepID=UPI002868796A|nr:DUF1351 domain-containing protein [uncultured Desulfovibrio sp.]
MALADSRMKLHASPPAVSFDFAGLVSWARGMTGKFENLVVTEDQVPEIKDCMTELNKAKISLDNSRKETVKELSAPLKAFEGQIKQVMAIFDETYKFLGDQVQHFVEQEREKKREVVQGIIAEELEKRKGEVQPFAIPIQDKWLLKSTTLKSIREAVQGIIDQRIESLRLQQQADQARAERASAIEQAVKATNAEYHLELSVAQFMTQWHTSLSTPLDDVCKDITGAAQRALARQAERKESARPSTAGLLSNKWVAPQTSAATAVTTAPAAEAGPDKTMSIIITYSPAKEGEVRLALAKLRGLCTTFSARARQ